MLKRICPFCFLFFLLIFLFSYDQVNNMEGKCIGVSDGDTITILKEKKPIKIRLEGIDCPEMGQDYGAKAKQFTSEQIFGKTVLIKAFNYDMYGRLIARVYLDNKDLSIELIENGLAWHFKKYSSDPILSLAEEEARRNKIGLWSQPDPIPPWSFRKIKRNKGG